MRQRECEVGLGGVERKETWSGCVLWENKLFFFKEAIVGLIAGFKCLNGNSTYNGLKKIKEMSGFNSPW